MIKRIHRLDWGDWNTEARLAKIDRFVIEAHGLVQNYSMIHIRVTVGFSRVSEERLANYSKEKRNQ